MDKLFVSCANYLEHLLQHELHHLGVTDVKRSRLGVFVPKTVENVYRINYCSRIATRVLWPIVQFRCGNRDDLYNTLKQIDWLEWFSVDETFAIDANVSHPALRNSHFAALVVKDAICDHFRDRLDKRPSVQLEKPNIQFNLFVSGGIATLSLDTSGYPLFKRGWRTNPSEAPLQESLAAALLFCANYTKEELFCDPFCGSGTFLIEAALMATKTPPGFLRKTWGFFKLPNFDGELWQKVKKKADSKKVPLAKGTIFGCDRDFRAIDACKEHLENAGLRPFVEAQCTDIAQYRPPAPPTLLLTNPPYGKRLATSDAMLHSLREFIQKKGSERMKTFLLLPEHSLLKALQMRIRASQPFSNGGIPVELFSVDGHPPLR